MISRINRWMIAGAVGLTAVVSLVAKESFHGRTLSGTAVRSSSASTSGHGASSSSSGSTGSIQQPAQAPSSVPAPVVPSAPVVSGGS
jgi:hypothetical protein